MTYYGYGAARMPLAMPYTRRVQISGRAWMYHPSLLGLIASLLVLWLSRSCVITTPRSGRTVLWLQEVPKTVAPERYETTPVARQPLEKPTPAEPEVAEKPAPIPEKPPEMKAPDLVMKKKPESIPHRIARMPEKSIPSPSAAPQRLISRNQEAEAVKQYRLAGKPDLPRVEKDLQQLKKQTPSPPAVSGAVRRKTEDFRPIAPAPAAARSLKKADHGQAPSRHAILATGDRHIQVGHDGPARSIAPAAPGTSRDDRRILDLPDRVGVPAGAVPDNAPEQRSSGQSKKTATIRIIGTVTGESMRIENLKRAIFRKAEQMDGRFSPYCCTIKGIDCKLAIGGNQPILSFSTSVIPFEVVSKLERRLPEGMTACTD